MTLAPCFSASSPGRGAQPLQPGWESIGQCGPPPPPPGQLCCLPRSSWLWPRKGRGSLAPPPPAKSASSPGGPCPPLCTHKRSVPLYSGVLQKLGGKRGSDLHQERGGGGGGGVSDPDIKLPGIKLARKTNCFVSGESAQVLHVARAGSNTQLEQDRALAPGTLARALAPPCMAHAPSAHAPSAHTDRHAHAPAWDVASVWSLVEVPTAWWPQQGPSIRVARGPASAQHLPAHSSLAAVRGVSPSPQDGPPTRPGKRSSGSSLHGSPCTWGSVV